VRPHKPSDMKQVDKGNFFFLHHATPNSIAGCAT